jgi:hypothetical protein
MHDGPVAGIEKRVRGYGTVTFREVWRDPTHPGRQSIVFDHRRQVEQTTKSLDANGRRFTPAVNVANTIRQGGPAVEDVVREQFELLNRVSEGTETGDRLQVRDHIARHIGALPGKALTWHESGLTRVVGSSRADARHRTGYRSASPSRPRGAESSARIASHATRRRATGSPIVARTICGSNL